MGTPGLKNREDSILRVFFEVSEVNGKERKGCLSPLIFLETKNPLIATLVEEKKRVVADMILNADMNQKYEHILDFLDYQDSDAKKKIDDLSIEHSPQSSSFR